MKILRSRRRLLQKAVTATAGMLLARLATAQEDVALAAPQGAHGQRALELHNTHNSEVVSAIFRHGEEYAREGIAKLRHALRDHRTGDSHDMDPALYDQLYELAVAAGREPRFEIISGYRSPATNARLAAASDGVAKRSLHMQGRAIDVRLQGYSTEKLRDLALAARNGGVGYYARSDFLHLDTGRFRTWSG